MTTVRVRRGSNPEVQATARGVLVLLVAAGLLAMLHACAAPQETVPASRVVYLVRHAETVPKEQAADPNDPDLSEVGSRRAEALALALRAEEITRVLGTDYRRTQQTAAPLASRFGLHVESYDPRALEQLARTVLASSGRLVIVGHSNTTPALVELLGGDPGAAIDEAREYDRLYVLTFAGDRRPTTLHLRYGEPPAAAAGAAGSELMREFKREAPQAGSR